MRCLNCGTEMGNHKVCPVCNTPGRNILCGENIEAEYYGDETQIMYQDNLDNVPVKYQDAIEKKNDNEIKITETKKSYVITDENIDKLLGDNSPKKKKSHLKKVLFIIGIITVVLLLTGIAIIFIKDRKYWEGLKNPEIIFSYEGKSYDINGNLIENEDALECVPDNALMCKVSDNKSVIWCEETDKGTNISLKNIYGTFLVQNVPNKLVNIYISSKGCYGAYSETWTYRTWVEDRNSESGGRYETVNVTDLYRISPYGESKLMVSEEKPITLTGVTDDGNIIYIDDEENETVSMSDTDREIIDGKVDKAVIYNDTGAGIFLTDKGELYYIKGNIEMHGNNIGDYENTESYKIATDVKDFYYINDNGYEKKVKQVEDIASTESISMMIIYVKEGVTYVHDTGNKAASTRLMNQEIDILKIYYLEDKQIYYRDGEIFRHYIKKDSGLWTYEETDRILRLKNCCGKGYCELRDGIVYYHDKMDWKLDNADEIKCLAGRWVYYVKDGKTYRQDIRNKKTEKLFEMDMNIELIQNEEGAACE